MPEGPSEQVERRAGQRYPVTCAWCAAEGTYRVVSYSAQEGSHGICPDHQEKLRRQLRDLQERKRATTRSKPH